MAFISDKRLMQNIQTYCNGSYDKTKYVSEEDCISKQRVDYGLDLTKSDTLAITIAVIGVILAVIAMFLPRIEK